MIRFTAALASLVLAASLAAAAMPPEDEGYLPGPDASRIVSVSASGTAAAAAVVVQTHAVAVKETGPKETVRAFGEVYAFSPSFFAVHRDEPTLVTFWNLQPDDLHDFMLMDPQYEVLMKVLLPPLKKTAYVLTFHREGLFRFYCAAHPPEMAGQILVLPPVSAPSPAAPAPSRGRR